MPSRLRGCRRADQFLQDVDALVEFFVAPALQRSLVAEFVYRGFFPAGTGLQPEDRGGDGFASLAGRLAVEVLRDLAVGLDRCGRKLLRVVPFEDRTTRCAGALAMSLARMP